MSRAWAPPTRVIDSPAAVRRINRAHVLRIIQLDGPMTRPAVVRASGLSKATVRQVCDGLIAEGLVAEEVPETGADRGPGRPAASLRFQGAKGQVLGIDIGADNVLVLVADLGGQVLENHRVTVGAAGRPSRDDLLRVVTTAVGDALAGAGVERSTVRMAAVGTPGVVAPDTGVVRLAPQIAGWEGTRLAAELEERLGITIRVESEVQLAVVGERWRGAANDLDDAIYLQLGIGIAAGSLVNGELHRGAAGGAGEIGYLPVRGASAPPHGVGAFEWSAGGHAFAREGQAAARRPDGARLLELAGGVVEAVNAELVFAAAREHDPTAQAIVLEMTERLAYGVAALACVLNPAVVVVGGGLSNAGADLLTPLQRSVDRMVPLPPRLVLSALSDQAVALGALRMALEATHQELDLLIDQ
ncbi:MAG: transcriptional regulator [Solirubrobacterales bacterium]|nr:transcriptional regulator [Solirubrobacterales bacterium]